jgi:hypothetical protein
VKCGTRACSRTAPAAKAIRPGEACLSRKERQAGRIGRSRPVRTDRRGRWALRRPSDPGDGRKGLTPRSAGLFEAERRRELSDGFGNGERAYRPRPCPDPQGTAQASGPGRDPREPETASAVPRDPPTQRVMALPRRGDRETGTLGAGGDVSPHFDSGTVDPAPKAEQSPETDSADREPERPIERRANFSTRDLLFSPNGVDPASLRA